MKLLCISKDLAVGANHTRNCFRSDCSSEAALTNPLTHLLPKLSRRQFLQLFFQNCWQTFEEMLFILIIWTIFLQFFSQEEAVECAGDKNIETEADVSGGWWVCESIQSTYRIMKECNSLNNVIHPCKYFKCAELLNHLTKALDWFRDQHIVMRNLSKC